MVEWVAGDECIRGFGERESVHLGVSGWRPRGRPPALRTPVDAATVGTTRGLRLSTPARLADGTPLSTDTSFDGGVHRIVADGAVETRIAFEGAATVETGVEDDEGDDSGVRLRFPAGTAVTVGFREGTPERPSLSVPPTPAGLAAAVTAAGATPRTTGPRRSHPGFRPRTPTVDLDESATAAVPSGLSAPTDDPPTMTVPASTTAVLVAAPLAYYLGARLRIEEGPPRLRGPGLDRAFAALPAFAEEAADALRRLVALDCRLRSLPGEPLNRPPGIEADIEARPPTERLAAALDWTPDGLPTWPLSTYVVDDPATGRYLPYLLDRLSLVHPASASRLDPKALLERSLDEFFRGEAPNVEAVDPALSESRHHAWLGDGTPVDAYTLLGAPTGGTSSGGDLTVEVVCNDAAMAAERNVADVYRQRLTSDDADVRVHERLSTTELAALLETEADLVHFIGHCEVDGLVCRDGTLAAADLDACRVGAFFLNACGSYYEGFDLVRQGASVGAVTLTTVLDEQAVSLGTTFAELLAAGFAFERALSLARGEIIVGRDYAVVGDGTQRLRTAAHPPGVFTVTPTDGGRYSVDYDVTPPDAAGRRYWDPIAECYRPCGETATATLGGDRLREVLSGTVQPVRYDGALRWSDALARELDESRQA
ncbi:hypothetical protein [Natronomonas amylolytica]|uniref:hypothetical protein n=1 Tax=Natronomonas amylolytica TaxID=3108498 RepID=UPI0030094114